MNAFAREQAMDVLAGVFPDDEQPVVRVPDARAALVDGPLPAREQAAHCVEKILVGGHPVRVVVTAAVMRGLEVALHAFAIRGVHETGEAVLGDGRAADRLEERLHDRRSGLAQPV